MQLMPRMSSQLTLAAAASTLALVALAIGSPSIGRDAHGAASMVPAVAEMPAPLSLPSLLR